MENINKKALLLAIIFAMATTMVIYLYVSNLKGVEKVNDTTSVYFVVKTLSPRHKILDGDVKAKNIKSDLVNKSAIRNKKDAIGKYLKETAIEGEQLLLDRLVSEKDFLLSYNIKENLRAVSINVNEQIQVGNLLLPGDYVDVIASFEEELIGQEKIPRYTKTIIQNVKVLAIGNIQNFDESKKVELPKTVTLAVNYKDAEKIIYATDYGIIRLVLRAVGDKALVKTNGIRSKDFRD